MKTKILRALLYIAIAGTALLLIALFKIYVSAPFVEEEITSISIVQEKQLEMYSEMIKLLITLSTFLFGAIGGMFAHFYEAKTTPRSQMFLAFAGIALAGASLLFGYFSYQRVVWMLQVKAFNLSEPHIAWASHLQFLLFIVSAIVAAIFGYRATEETAT